ncbi:DJ-1/PfpI family protein [Herbidospora mongoliensis]|uniref:DJ-1/PfpI family protein n=1 Tax=Herbidospora mongoliensis TaxID=688067 RepID=UPI00082CB4C1|nr:DJ-1/PfpI family protein [Herbidospora mongoliensis]
MRVAIPLYPGFTALDAVGPYTVLAFTPGISVTFVAGDTGPVLDDQGSLSIIATATYDELPDPDVILVPGGPGTVEALNDARLVEWIRTAHQTTTWTTSVCSGSFLLAHAGLLKGLPATTHWGFHDQLAGFGAIPVAERVVTEGKVVTAAGVSAGIDMALELLARLRDEDTARAVQLAMEYDPAPPFTSGSAANASPELRKRAMGLIVGV